MNVVAVTKQSKSKSKIDLIAPPPFGVGILPNGLSITVNVYCPNLSCLVLLCIKRLSISLIQGRLPPGSPVERGRGGVERSTPSANPPQPPAG